MTLPGERGIHPARARERQWRCRALPEWPTALKFAGELPWDRLLDLPSAEMSLQLAGVILLITLLVGGCLERPLPPPSNMHHAPGGGYVSGDTSYHGSMGP
jgi:hypothetical protein